MIPSFSSIQEARRLLARYLPVTRLVPAPSLGRAKSTAVYLKLDSELPTGSFKPRGALYALAVNLERRKIKEVVASSTGNHGAAVAYAAHLLGVPARIFLPSGANPVKRARIAALGAHIVEQGAADLAEAFQLASKYAHQDGVLFLNDATDPDLPAGPATIACEIVEQLPDADAIFVPMGDTALIRGVAAAAKHLSPGIRIIGVQAEQAPSYALSWQQNRVVETDTCETIADGLATRLPDEANVRAIRQLVDEVVVVSETEMLRAIRSLLMEEHVVAEPAGAAATAAFQKSRSISAKNVVLLVSGANIAPEILRRAVTEN